jgi:hypothetical protein
MLGKTSLPQHSLVSFGANAFIHVLSTIMTTLRRNLPLHVSFFCKNGDILVKRNIFKKKFTKNQNFATK